MVMLVLRPRVLGQRTLEVEALSRNKVVDVGAHWAVGVFLDQEINIALFSYTMLQLVHLVAMHSWKQIGFTFVANWGVGSESGLLIVGALVLGQNGAGNLKSRDHVALRELETKALGVVVDNLDIGQLQRDKSLIAASKGRLRRNNLLHLGGDGRAAAEVIVASSGDGCTTCDVEKGVGSAL